MSAPDFSTRPRVRQPGVFDLLLLGAGLLAAALCVRGILGARVQAAAARARQTEVRQEIEAERQRLVALEKGARDGVAGQAWLTAAVPPPRVLRELGELLPPDVRLASLSLTYGRGLEVEMRVVARNPQAYDRLLERLESSPRLKDLVLGAEDREGEVATTLRATFVPAP